jgi:hypothetical protein
MGFGWLASRSAHFTPGKDPVHVVQEAGWAPGPLWTGAQNLSATGTRSPECSAVAVPATLSRPTEMIGRM